MARWEYCVVFGYMGRNPQRHIDTNGPGVFRFHANGYDVTPIKGRDEGSQIAATIAQLGLDGWELVVANQGELFFKRPIPD
jgi:hypothetical protein